jgi:hypothetical protein
LILHESLEGLVMPPQKGYTFGSQSAILSARGGLSCASWRWISATTRTGVAVTDPTGFWRAIRDNLDRRPAAVAGAIAALCKTLA